MSRAYGLRVAEGEHHLRDGDLVLLAVCAVAGVWSGSAWPGLVVGSAMVLRGRRIAALVCVAVSLGGVALGQRAWAQVQPRQLGPYEGVVALAADPAPLGAGLRVTLEIEGERFDAWLYGGARRKLEQRQAGDRVWLRGRRVALGSHARRAQIRHVVGRFEVEATGDVHDGTALARASNRVRHALRATAARTMSPTDAALFTGLVIGDDSRQPAWLVDEFRRSGLSHLTAVSGQNVAFAVAAALPLLRRLRPWWRWMGTMSLIAWFMALTRFEPSVMRAGSMAMLAATAFVLGHRPSPLRLLALAVTALVLLDPLLVWSVGFWLSVGATMGVCIGAPWLHHRLRGPSWFRLSLAVTLGAQAGVALPSVLVFRRLPVVAVAANLVAVPIAGLVMLVGLPAGLIAASLPAPLERFVMAPAVIGTRWVATVARIAARLEPSPGWSMVGWVLVSAALVVSVRGRSRPSASGVPI